MERSSCTEVVGDCFNLILSVIVMVYSMKPEPPESTCHCVVERFDCQRCQFLCSGLLMNFSMCPVLADSLSCLMITHGIAKKSAHTMVLMIY